MIRRLVPADAPAYRALMLDAYGRHPTAFTSTVADREALPLSWWAARLSDAAGAIDAVFGTYADAHADAALAGVVGIEFGSRDKTRHKAELFGMVVARPSQGRGIGKALADAAIDHARRCGAALVQLTVTQGNVAAVRLYERCGFTVYGVEPLAIRVGDDYLSKVHMWCDLRSRPGVRP
jgi:ribosomal protein S18 acetylase RimI-like enzyme